MKTKVRRWFGLFFLLSAFVINSQNGIILFPTVLFLTFMLDKYAFNAFRHLKFWTIYFLILFLFPFFSAAPDKTFLGLGFNSARMIQTILMSGRSIIIFLSIQILLRDINPDELQIFFSKIGIHGLDKVYPATQEFMPRIRKIIQARIAIYRRDVKTGNRIKKSYNLLIDMIVDLLNLIDSHSRQDVIKNFTTHELYEKILSVSQNNRVIVLMGHEHGGKTTMLQNVVQLFKNNDYSVGGIISPGILSGDRKVIIEVEDITSGTRKILAQSQPVESSLIMGKYFFHEEVFQWCHQVMESAFHCDYIIVDEYGPIEMQKKGFFPAIQKWYTTGSGTLLLTLRPTLIDQLMNQFFKMGMDDKQICVIEI